MVLRLQLRRFKNKKFVGGRIKKILLFLLWKTKNKVERKSEQITKEPIEEMKKYQ